MLRKVKETAQCYYIRLNKSVEYYVLGTGVTIQHHVPYHRPSCVHEHEHVHIQYVLNALMHAHTHASLHVHTIMCTNACTLLIEATACVFKH